MKAIEAHDLTKRFGKTLAVDHLNLSIGEGELFALLGVNGAGKTTTVRMLAGLTMPTEGDALLLNESVVKNPLAAKAHASVSPQETAIARNLSVRENLELLSRLYGADRVTAARRAGELLERLSLEGMASHRARTLSGGMQRRLSIAMALVSEPKILFLDEPTLGLDVLARRELWRMILQLKGKVTMLLTTHYLEEVEALADRAGILANGRMRAVGTVEELVRRTNARSFEDAFVALATDGEGIA